MTTPLKTLATGNWGGEQVVLMVDATTARLRLGCAEAAFDAPITLDGRGRFSRRGTYTAFAGGPAAPATQGTMARFDGAIEGQRLVLTVTHGRSAETYHLTFGLQSKVIRCL